MRLSIIALLTIISFKYAFVVLRLSFVQVIDATRHANLLRFTNHSCNPNCEMQKWNVRGVMRVGLFAIKDIPANSELCFDYQMEMFDKKPVKASDFA